MSYSVGIGLTNDCNLNCDHCYRDTDSINHVSLSQIKQICQAVPVAAMGMGTGENALNPEFIPIVRYLHQQGVKLSIASNGYSLTTMPDDILSAFHDVEVSIDFASEAEQDAFREAGNWSLVHRAIERCHQVGVEVSILATLMSNNFDQMDKMVQLARRNGCYLRVNVYQAVKNNAYTLSYEQFWEGYQRLFAEGQVISCSEPVVRAVMGLGEASSPCGRHSIRINPRGQVIPCVYWPVDSRPIPDIGDLADMGSSVLEGEAFRIARHTPASALDCPCQGGCASRRALNGRMDAHDDYCPWVRHDTIDLRWNPAPAKDLMRSSNVCTTVVA